MKVPFLDLQLQHKKIRKDIERAIKGVIKKGDFVLGSEVQEFEKEFAAYCQSRYALGVSSGTSALFLALLALGVKKDDEVIVPGFTFIATALAVSYTGAKPVFVDIDEDTYTIDVAKMEKAITSRTKAVIPVHLYGQPAHMADIVRVAKHHNLSIVEDAAQAHGARAKMADGWKTVGSIGDIGCFSFYPSKNLGALGDGGMVVTDNEKLYHCLKIIRDCGRVSKYEHEVIGYNSRLDTLQAAVLRIKLKHLNEWNQMRRDAAKEYDRLLEDVEGVITPVVGENAQHVYHVYAIRAEKRNDVLSALHEKNIGAMVHYPLPLHLQLAYGALGYQKGDFPLSEEIAHEIISLPIFPYIRQAQIEYVVHQIAKVCN